MTQKDAVCLTCFSVSTFQSVFHATKNVMCVYQVFAHQNLLMLPKK